MRIHEFRGALDIFDTALVEVTFVNTVKACDVSIPPRLQGRPVVSVDIDVETVVDRMLQVVLRLSGIPHDLLGHAADIDARAAQRPVLDDAGARTVFCRTLRVREPAAAAAYDQ